MIPRPAWKLIYSVVAFLFVYFGGLGNGSDPNFTLAIAAAAGFGTLVVTWKIGA